MRRRYHHQTTTIWALMSLSTLSCSPNEKRMNFVAKSSERNKNATPQQIFFEFRAQLQLSRARFGCHCRRNFGCEFERNSLKALSNCVKIDETFWADNRQCDGWETTVFSLFYNNNKKLRENIVSTKCISFANTKSRQLRRAESNMKKNN